MSEKEDSAGLEAFIQKEITKLFSSILDFGEVVIVDKERYLIYRSKILRLSNDAIRDIKKEIEVHYKVKFVPTSEDVIRVKQPRNR